MFDRGVRNHLLSSRLAVPAMLAQGSGLLVTTTFWDRGHYIKGNLFYDLAKGDAMGNLAGFVSLALNLNDAVEAFEGTWGNAGV